MKKTFPLQAPGKDDARVRDKIRHEVNKDAARQRRKPLPEGAHHWAFACKIGPSEAAAEPRVLNDLGAAIETLAAGGAKEVYIEIAATPVT